MIGQTKLKRDFSENFIKKKILPKTILLIGSDGSGRKTFAHWVADEIGYNLVISEIGVNDIRELNDLCNKVVEPTIYLVPNVEQMSGAGQNALLKLLEEPPNNAYFILTTTQLNLILSTIDSRSIKFYMDSYTISELQDYTLEKYPEVCDMKLLQDIYAGCTCPGEIDKLLSQDVVGFFDYVNLVIANIDRVSGPNSFKIANKIRLKTEDEQDKNKYDLGLFWRFFIQRCLENMDLNPKKYLIGINITTGSLQLLNVRGANKQMAFDTWVMNIRREWFKYADN